MFQSSFSSIIFGVLQGTLFYVYFFQEWSDLNLYYVIHVHLMNIFISEFNKKSLFAKNKMTQIDLRMKYPLSNHIKLLNIILL